MAEAATLDAGPPAGAPGRHPASLTSLALSGAGAGTAVVTGAVLGGSTFVSHLPGAWYFGSPGGPLGSLGASGTRAPLLSLVLVYGGLILAIRSWLALLKMLAERPGFPVRRVIGVIAVWMIPFLIAPPLFSRDVYSYAGQGEMVSHHIDPYHYGTGVLGVTPFATLPGSLWANTPSPYGPTFLAADGLATVGSGHEALPDLLLLRLLELAGLALMAAAIPTLARAAGRDPAGAVALGVGSPLALSTLIGGAHNDALMVGLMLAGVALAQRHKVVAGLMLCALAAGVKAPAALAIVFIGWNWAPFRARPLARVARTLLALAIAGATLSAISSLSGLGWGWLHTLSAAGKVSTGVTPVDTLAHVAYAVVATLHIPLSFAVLRAGLDAVGLGAAVAFALWMLWRSPRHGLVRGLGLSYLVLALAGPILWAWYLSWGLVTSSAVAAGWLRRCIVVLTSAWALIGAASVRGVVVSFVHASIVPELCALAVLAFIALVPLPWLRGGSDHHEPRAEVTHVDGHRSGAVVPAVGES